MAGWPGREVAERCDRLDSPHRRLLHRPIYSTISKDIGQSDWNRLWFPVDLRLAAHDGGRAVRSPPCRPLTGSWNQRTIPPVSTPSVIAIDGPVASGKTSVGRALAVRLGYRFVDTGLMYRALTLLALRRGIDPGDAASLGGLAAEAEIGIVTGAAGTARVLLDGADVTDGLRTPAVDGAVSAVSQVPAVRHAMVARQQRIAEGGSVVMVGRDIGTVVLPSAAKVYLSASPAERARRRHAELEGAKRARAQPIPSIEDVRENLALRDKADTERAEGPLRVAEDAVRIETDGLDLDAVVAAVLSRIDA